MPNLFNYRDNREERRHRLGWQSSSRDLTCACNRQDWLQKIMDAYAVSRDGAKRLTTIIISGGQFVSWLRKVGKKDHVKQPLIINFVKGLQMEVRVLNEQLLQHSRYKWVDIERKRLLADGKQRTRRAVEAALLPRIVASCESSILNILHRTLDRLGWTVRAKVFDGLIAEKGGTASTDLAGAMRACEDECLKQGWGVKLAEKPLHGLQDSPVHTLSEVMRFMQLPF